MAPLPQRAYQGGMSGCQSAAWGPNPETPLTEEEEEWDELEEAHIKDKKTLISDFSIWRSLVRLEASCFS